MNSRLGLGFPARSKKARSTARVSPVPTSPPPIAMISITGRLWIAAESPHTKGALMIQFVAFAALAIAPTLQAEEYNFARSYKLNDVAKYSVKLGMPDNQG